MTLVDVLAGTIPVYAGFTTPPLPVTELTDLNWNDFSTPGFVYSGTATITFDLGGLINIDTLQFMIKYQLWGSWYAGECPHSAIYIQLFDGTTWVQAHTDIRSPVCGVPGRTYYDSGLQTINITFPYKYTASMIQIKLVASGGGDNPANASISGTRIMAFSDVCVPFWQCEPGQTGYEIDGCGNRRLNPACNPPQTGSISFTSNPPGAEIYIDGENQLVRTPATITNVSVGTHTYKLVLSGHRDASGTFTIEAGKTTTVSVLLTKVEAAVGAGTILGISLLGLGVIGAVVVATREKKPEYTLPGYKGG